MRYDVVVVGGGSAGVAAAIGAAQTGANACLVERYPFFGGAATVSSVLSYCGFFDQNREPVVAGVGELLLARLRAAGAYQEITFKWSGNTVVMIDPEFTKLALDGLVREAGVTSLLGGYVTSAGVTNDVVDHVTVAYHGSTRRDRGGRLRRCQRRGRSAGSRGSGDVRRTRSFAPGRDPEHADRRGGAGRRHLLRPDAGGGGPLQRRPTTPGWCETTVRRRACRSRARSRCRSSTRTSTRLDLRVTSPGPSSRHAARRGSTSRHSGTTCPAGTGPIWSRPGRRSASASRDIWSAGRRSPRRTW